MVTCTPTRKCLNFHKSERLQVPFSSFEVRSSGNNYPLKFTIFSYFSCPPSKKTPTTQKPMPPKNQNTVGKTIKVFSEAPAILNNNQFFSYFKCRNSNILHIFASSYLYTLISVGIITVCGLIHLLAHFNS